MNQTLSQTFRESFTSHFMVSHYQSWLLQKNFWPEEIEIFVKRDSNVYSRNEGEEILKEER
jgi:hypothetical protein